MLDFMHGAPKCLLGYFLVLTITYSQNRKPGNGEWQFILGSFKIWAPVVSFIDGFTCLLSRVHFPNTFAV